MITEHRTGGSAIPEETPLLLFHAAGVALGVAAAAVERILDAGQARQSGIACRSLAAASESEGAASSAPVKVLLFKGRGDQCGMGIDALDEIVTIPTQALQPLPEPLSYFRGPRSFWGGVVRADKVVLLVDVDRFHESAPAIDEALL